MIQITMTATLRPLLGITLSSLFRFVRCREAWCLVLNIDPAPRDAELTPLDVLLIAARHVCVVHHHTPPEPSFSRAVRHVWAETTSDIVLHLEDDWEFFAPVDLDAAAAKIRSGLYDFVRFGATRDDGTPVHDTPSDTHPSLSLPPALWNGAVCRNLAAHMTDAMDPEKQLRPKAYAPLTPHLVPPTRMYEERLTHCCRDLGRPWAKARGLRKWDTRGRNQSPHAITWAAP